MTGPFDPPALFEPSELDKEAEVKRRLDGLVTDWLDARSAAEKHKEIADELASQIIALVGVGRSHELAPNVGVQVCAGAVRFDPDRAEDVLQHAVSTGVITDYVAAVAHYGKLSQANVAKILPGELLQRCKGDPGGPTVRALGSQRRFA